MRQAVHTKPGTLPDYRLKNSSSASVRPLRIAAIFGILSILGISLILAPPLDPLIERFSRGLVAASGALIHVFGGRADVEGIILRSPVNGNGIQMMNGCNGIDVTVLLWSAMLAFPASWIQKLKGMALGGLVIQALNLVRFISLFYLRQYSASWFEFAHGYLWQSLIVLDAMVFLWLWARFVASANAKH